MMINPDELILLADFQKKFKLISMQVFRSLIAQRKTNGFNSVVLKICGRWYVNEKKFYKWIEKER